MRLFFVFWLGVGSVIRWWDVETTASATCATEGKAKAEARYNAGKELDALCAEKDKDLRHGVYDPEKCTPPASKDDWWSCTVYARGYCKEKSND